MQLQAKHVAGLRVPATGRRLVVRAAHEAREQVNLKQAVASVALASALLVGGAAVDVPAADAARSGGRASARRAAPSPRATQ